MPSIYDLACCDAPLLLSSTFDADDHLSSASASASREEGVSNAAESSKQYAHNEYENKEAFGWMLDAIARGVAIMGAAVFVSSELLRLAKEAAGCENGSNNYNQYDNFNDNENIYNDQNSVYYDNNNQNIDRCENRVHGMKPSSILTNILTIVGLISAALMPLIGSVIDHTRYRKLVGQISAAALSVFIILQMIFLIVYFSWFAAAIVQIFIAFSYTVHLCVVYAYLPELTTCHERLTHYTAQFTAAQYGSSVFFLIVMVAVLTVAAPADNYDNNSNNYQKDQNQEQQIKEELHPVELSQSFVFIICFISFGIAWTCLFQQRPPSQHVPTGETLLSSGFTKIFKTARAIMYHHRALFWFLLSVTFTEAATYTFSTIAITYMTDQLHFTSRDNGIAILILLLFGVPGTRLAKWLTNILDPVRSLQACLLLWIVNTTLAAIILRRPNQQGTAYIFAMFWGLALGWVNPTEKTLYCTIIPRGQEAQLMGTYICAGQILSWLPSLVFSVINEAGISMRIGLFSLSIYFLISFLLLFLVGDYHHAVQHAKQLDYSDQNKKTTINDHGQQHVSTPTITTKNNYQSSNSDHYPNAHPSYNSTHEQNNNVYGSNNNTTHFLRIID